MDLFIGVPSLLYDPNKERRTLYGKAGSFRLTPYGLEYRVLSAAMYDNVNLMGVIWDGIIRSIQAYNEGFDMPSYGLIRQVIDTSNVSAAKELIRKHRLI